MIKNILKYASVIATLLVLFGSSVFAASGSVFTSGFDVSIDRVIVNGQAVSQSENNLIKDDNFFFLQVDGTAVKDLEKGHVEASLRGRKSGNTVADATGTIDVAAGNSFSSFLSLNLVDDLRREDDFELTVRIINARGSSEQKTYGIRTKGKTSGSALDVSINRVIVNNAVLAASRNTFVEENDVFNAVVEFTSLEDSEFVHVEAVLRDLRTGFVVSDSTITFDIFQDKLNNASLRLELLDDLRKSDSLELEIKIVNADGDTFKRTYGIRMEDGALRGNGIDVSIDRVEVESHVVSAGDTNFVIIKESAKNLDVKVRLTSLESIDNARIEAVLEFENGNVAADTTQTFNMGNDQLTTQNLDLDLIGKFEQNTDMKLRIKIIDAEGNSIEKMYGLRISRQKTPFLLSFISVGQNLQPGKSASIRLNILNSGVVPVDAVIAEVSIPELGISLTKFFDRIAGNHAEEFILKIPQSAEPGTYTIRAEIKSQFSSEVETRQVSLSLAAPREHEAAPENNLRIEVPVSRQSMQNDGKGTIYPLIFTNNDVKSHAYTVLLEGDDGLELMTAESNTFVLNPGESINLNVQASTRSKDSGEKSFNVIVRENQKTLAQVQLKSDVISQSFAGSGFRIFAMAVLILIAVGLAGAGLFYGLKGYMQKADENGGNGADESIIREIPEGEAYY